MYTQVCLPLNLCRRRRRRREAVQDIAILSITMPLIQRENSDTHNLSHLINTGHEDESLSGMPS